MVTKIMSFFILTLIFVLVTTSNFARESSKEIAKVKSQVTVVIAQFRQGGSRDEDKKVDQKKEEERKYIIKDRIEDRRIFEQLMKDNPSYKIIVCNSDPPPSWCK